MADTVRCRIVGGSRVGGVEPGGVVDLDPEVTNIPALIEAGHVEVVPGEAKAPKGAGGKAATEGGGA